MVRKMTTKHDFKRVIERIKEQGETACLFELKATPEILFALALADRIQSGEVSQEMIKKGHTLIVYTPITNVEGLYKVMTEQLMKEVNDDLL